MQSRFMKGSVNPTILCLASSKRTEQSYMETFIESKKNNESKTTKVVDEPQWVIREDKNSDVKFKVALGNKFLSSEVIPLDATESDVQLFIDRGFTILEVPIGYYENFIDDIDIALTDIAGISTTSSSRYIAGHRISAIKDSTIKNPFVSDVLEIGDGKDDTNQYYDFFNMELVDKSLLQYPMYVHLDMSVSGDKTGLGGVWIVGKKPPVEGQPPSKELFYRLSFMVSIKAPKGHQISFEKNRQFIYWLKENGFNIKGVSCDTYQSADLLQQLKGKGFDTEIISVDRVKDNICQPYQYLKSTIYEERLVIFEDNLLVEELIGLERNNSNGKVDHAPTGINSKDSADALCGAIWNASQHGEEFDFEFGETLDTIVDVSLETSEKNYKTQVTIDFEDELKKVSNSFSESLKNDKSVYTDFGLGASTTDYSMYDCLII